MNLVAVSKWGPPSNTKVKCNMDWMNNEQPLWNSQFFSKNLLTPWSIWRKFLTFLIAPLPPMYTGWENVIRENKPWGKSYFLWGCQQPFHHMPSVWKNLYIFGYFLVCWESLLGDVTVGRLCWLYFVVFGKYLIGSVTVYGFFTDVAARYWLSLVAFWLYTSDLLWLYFVLCLFAFKWH